MGYTYLIKRDTEVKIMQILKVQNISKVYGNKKGSKQYMALKSISFEVNEGEFIGVMGASGSGKTTLLNILGSIDKPTTGRFIMDGKDIANLNKNELARHRVKNIGFIFQDYNLLETMTLKENIILPLTLSGYKVDVIEDRLMSLTKDLGIINILNKYPYEVSGGEQQRAAACRALITNPKLILADEPTGSLDSRSGRDLLELLTFINKSYRATILMVTHDVYAASYCQKILFIRDGEIYNELYAGDDKKKFFDSIIDVMSVLGGGIK
jgi:putative ABC transport system ATP-binding protein